MGFGRCCLAMRNGAPGVSRVGVRIRAQGKSIVQRGRVARGRAWRGNLFDRGVREHKVMDDLVVDGGVEDGARHLVGSERADRDDT